MSTRATKGTTTWATFCPVRGLSKRPGTQLSSPGRQEIHADAHDTAARAYRREVLNSTLNRASGVVIYIVFPSSPPNAKLTNEFVPAGACKVAICLPAGEKTHNPPGPAV